MTVERRPRIGILGGTFDPIHCGHLDVGAAAQRALGLTRMLVIPSNMPPHRPQPRHPSFHRFAMAALAVAGRPGWRCRTSSCASSRTSYTTTTLQQFHDRGYRPTELFFIIGADAFADIATWRDYPRDSRSRALRRRLAAGLAGRGAAATACRPRAAMMHHAPIDDDRTRADRSF